MTNVEARIAEAVQGRSRAIVRVQFELPAWDPWRLLEVAQRQGRPWFAWSSRDGGDTMLALGAVVHHEGRERRDWSDTSAYCSSIAEQLITLPLWEGDATHDDPPLLVGGFGFAPADQDANSVWRGWAGGSLWVPELVLLRRAGRTSASVTCAWSPEDTAREVAERATRWRRDLETPPDARRVKPSARAPKRRVSHHEERAWGERVERALDAIERERLQKVVLARSARFTAGTGEIFDAANTLRALQGDQPDCDIFGAGHPDGSVFLGASPEPLMEKRGEALATVALAGTVGRGIGPAEDEQARHRLLSSEKDGREHALVVHAIVDALRPLASTVSSDPEPRLRSLSQVHHLETQVDARLDDSVDAFHVLAALHPTPATCGWPGAAAHQWIEEHETLDRGWYAGPVGWLNGAGDARFCVALRSALIRGDEAHAFGGAGLVRGSTPHGEWRETEMKLEAIARSLMTCHEELGS